MNKNLLIFFVALAPLIALFLRGIVWGADSFAFMAVSCGQTIFANKLSSPLWFTDLLPYLNCNFYLLVVVMFFFYLLALFGLKIFGEKLFGEQGFLFPIVVGSVTPLVFFEAVRFENQFFSWTMSFMVLGLFALYLKNNKLTSKALLLFLCVLLSVFSLLIWRASIIPLFMCFLITDFPQDIKNIVVRIGFITGLAFFSNYILYSFTQLLNPANIIAEELPIVGIIFLLPIIHLIKHVPKEFKLYTIIVLIIGLIKVKYIYLVVPLICIGLLTKELKEGLYIRNWRIPLIPICFYLLILLIISASLTFPTQNDLTEMNQAIQIANDNNVLLLNDWGTGWVFVYLGYDTNYKISKPNPDFNNHQRPFIAYTNEALDNCTQLTKKIYECN